MDEKEEGEISLEDVSSSDEMNYNNCNSRKSFIKSGNGLKHEIRDAVYGKENRRNSNELMGTEGKVINMEEKNEGLGQVSSDEEVERVMLPEDNSKTIVIPLGPKRKKKKKKKKKTNGPRMLTMDDLESTPNNDYPEIINEVIKQPSPGRHDSPPARSYKSPGNNYRSPRRHGRPSGRYSRTPSPHRRSPRESPGRSQTTGVHSARHHHRYYDNKLDSTNYDSHDRSKSYSNRNNKHLDSRYKRKDTTLREKLNYSDNSSNKKDIIVDNVQDEVWTDDDELDTEKLRRLALETKDQKKNNNNNNNNEQTGDLMNKNITTTNDDEDVEALELRMDALKSVINKKFQEKNKRCLLKKVQSNRAESPFDDNFVEEALNENNNSSNNRVLSSPLLAAEDMDLDSDVEREKELDSTYAADVGNLNENTSPSDSTMYSNIVKNNSFMLRDPRNRTRNTFQSAQSSINGFVNNPISNGQIYPDPQIPFTSFNHYSEPIPKLPTLVPSNTYSTPMNILCQSQNQKLPFPKSNSPILTPGDLKELQSMYNDPDNQSEEEEEPFYLRGIPDVTKDNDKIPTLVDKNLVPSTILKTNKQLQQPLTPKKIDQSNEPTFVSASMKPVDEINQSNSSISTFKPIRIQKNSNNLGNKITDTNMEVRVNLTDLDSNKLSTTTAAKKINGISNSISNNNQQKKIIIPRKHTLEANKDNQNKNEMNKSNDINTKKLDSKNKNSILNNKTNNNEINKQKTNNIIQKVSKTKIVKNIDTSGTKVNINNNSKNNKRRSSTEENDEKLRALAFETLPKSKRAKTVTESSSLASTTTVPPPPASSLKTKETTKPSNQLTKTAKPTNNLRDKIISVNNKTNANLSQFLAKKKRQATEIKGPQRKMIRLPELPGQRGPTVVVNKLATKATTSSRNVQRIVINPGNDSDSDGNDNDTYTPVHHKDDNLSQEVDKLLRSAREKYEIDTTLVQHLAPSKQEEYRRLKQKLAEKEKQTQAKKNNNSRMCSTTLHPMNVLSKPSNSDIASELANMGELVSDITFEPMKIESAEFETAQPVRSDINITIENPLATQLPSEVDPFVEPLQEEVDEKVNILIPEEQMDLLYQSALPKENLTIQFNRNDNETVRHISVHRSEVSQNEQTPVPNTMTSLPTSSLPPPPAPPSMPKLRVITPAQLNTKADEIINRMESIRPNVQDISVDTRVESVQQDVNNVPEEQPRIKTEPISDENSYAHEQFNETVQDEKTVINVNEPSELDVSKIFDISLLSTSVNNEQHEINRILELESIVQLPLQNQTEQLRAFENNLRQSRQTSYNTLVNFEDKLNELISGSSRQITLNEKIRRLKMELMLAEEEELRQKVLYSDVLKKAQEDWKKMLDENNLILKYKQNCLNLGINLEGQSYRAPKDEVVNEKIQNVSSKIDNWKMNHQQLENNNDSNYFYPTVRNERTRSVGGGSDTTIVDDVIAMENVVNNNQVIQESSVNNVELKVPKIKVEKVEANSNVKTQNQHKQTNVNDSLLNNNENLAESSSSTFRVKTEKEESNNDINKTRNNNSVTKSLLPVRQYESVLSSLQESRNLDPNGVLCPFESKGICSDESCTFNHLYR